MNNTEAVATLQTFGEGIHPDRNMTGDVPTHADFHEALATILGIPWNPSQHADHHRACAEALGIDPWIDSPGPLAGHAEHSTALLVAVAKRRIHGEAPVCPSAASKPHRCSSGAPNTSGDDL